MNEIPEGVVSLLHDVAYLSPDRPEKMDVYLPPDHFARPCPAVLLIHGGGWSWNDKRNEREQNIGHTLAGHGYAVFSINYLLNQGTKKGSDGFWRSQTVAWPQNLSDCQSALRFLHSEAKRFGIDASRIAVMGGSAGGHLAMLVGATASKTSVRCIVNFYGPADLEEESLAPFANLFAGTSKEATATNLRRASPRRYLSPATPPVLLVHGTHDEVIPVECSRRLSAELKNIGIEHHYEEVPEAIHSFHLQPPQADLRPLVLGFLAKHLNVKAPSV